jgi:hypothetical protein
VSLGDDGVWVTLDWGTPKVHLASGKQTPFGNEVALCGYVQPAPPKEGTEDEVDAENICASCQQKRGEGE